MTERIVFIATAWGTKFGGINSFNKDLCLALAQCLSKDHSITCVVLYADEKDISECQKRGLHLLPLDASSTIDNFEPHRAHEILSKLSQSFVDEVHWWIGHDVVTGEVALEACKTSVRGKCAIIHHMDYEAYKSFQETDLEKLWGKIERQIEILSAAHLVFGVGPKLTNSAKEKIRGKSFAPVHELIPGLPLIEGVDSPRKFSAITYGRLEQRNDVIKQVNLAVAGFAHARSTNPDPLGADSTLTIIGLSTQSASEEKTKICRIAEERAGKAIQIQGRPYLEDRAKLYDYLRRQSVCLMLSLHEGFGLAGWEAIGAEVPLIVSTNSGVFEAVDNLLSGMGTGCLTAVEIRGSIADNHFQEEDVTTVASAIKSIKLRETKVKQNAKLLKHLLLNICTWDNTAAVVAKALNFNIPVHSANLSIERWKPEFLINAIAQSSDMVENIARRKQQFNLVWDKMKPPAGFSKLLILFGGIASSLCDMEAARRYARWLCENPGARFFVCFESGPSAMARARKLDKNLLEAVGGLPSEAEERMREKEKRVLKLESLLQDAIGIHYAIVSPRIHFLPLKEPLTTYIMITDDDVYLTPLLETRSSETLSFALARKPIQFRLDVLNFIIYHLEKLENIPGSKELIEDLKQKIREDTDDI